MSHQRPQAPHNSSVDRRSFLTALGGATACAATGTALFDARLAHAAPSPQSTAETAVKQFHASLSEKQVAEICFPFNHPKRFIANANWHVTEPTIGDNFYSVQQRGLINDIVKGITSEEGAELLQTQMEDDDGGIDAYSVAMFGNPAEGPFQWELTGRHLTLRADGNSVDKTAFGGPLIYGHGEGDASTNLFYHQSKQVNEVFQALDSKQAKQALIARAPRESAVAIQGDQGTFPGIHVGELSSDQQALVGTTVQKLLSPYREEDVAEVMAILKESGDVANLHMAFYEQEDLDSDGIWDIWRIEGPSFVWHFRGAPHVHAYINISHDLKQNGKGQRRNR